MANYRILRKRNTRIISEDTIKDVSEQFNISKLLSEYLLSRNQSLDELEKYLEPSVKDMYDPFDFNDMAIFHDRIAEAVENSEKVLVYGDYDCDGICATSIMVKLLGNLGCDVTYYLPDRFTDGYGMNVSSLQKLLEDEITLVITVDNGISAIKEVEFLNENGCDVMITDHHEPGEVLPDALCILDAKVEGEYYPFKELCGAGLAYKIASSFELDDETMDELLAIASIATIADVVPLVSENRTIVSKGLKLIRQGKLKAVNEMCKVINTDVSALTAGRIAFQISPRLNASGRLVSANKAVTLFLNANDVKVGQICSELDQLNAERKEIEEAIFSKAEATLKDGSFDPELDSIIVCHVPDAHEGVIGIAASRLCEKYHRPAIVLTGTGELKASVRSIPTINIFEVLSNFTDLFLKFGGHSQAAGLSMKESDLGTFRTRLREYGKEKGLKELLYETCTYDMYVVASRLDVNAVKELKKLEPTGVGNPGAVFRMDNVRIANVRVEKTSGRHMMCDVYVTGANFSAVGFGMGHLAKSLMTHNIPYTILFTPNINSYRGTDSVQLELKSIFAYMDIDMSFYKSMYEYFAITRDNIVSLSMNEDNTINCDIEQLISLGIKNIVTYSYGCLERMVRYLTAKKIAYSVNFSNMLDESMSNELTIWVNPIVIPKTSSKVVIYGESLFGTLSDVKAEDISFIPSVEASAPYLRMNRDMMLKVYKSIEKLPQMGYDVYKFVASLDADFDVRINYFNVMASLDILSEIGVLSYTLVDGKLSIEFLQKDEKSDINSSDIMIKLSSILF